jgi:hypothetical protein
VILLLLTTSAGSSSAQETTDVFRAGSSLRQDTIDGFFGRTIDKIYWEGTQYMCSISPLSPLPGYDTVYNENPRGQAFFTIPVMLEKNYYAWWTVVNRKLFLYGVQSFFEVRDSSHLRRKIHLKDTTVTYLPELDSSFYELDFGKMEKFLNVKASRKLLPSRERKNERYKDGVIHAAWFTGALFLKRFPRDDEPFGSYEYYNEPYFRLDFRKGRLIRATVVTSMSE